MNFSNIPPIQSENNNALLARRTKCEVWTRVMGYHRPVLSFNMGKKSEHYSRQHFSETASLNSDFCKKYA